MQTDRARPVLYRARAAGEGHQRFAGRMRRLRDHHRLTGAQLADRCGEMGMPHIDKNVIAKVETKQRNLSLDEAITIAAALGTTLERMISPEPFTIEIMVE